MPLQNSNHVIRFDTFELDLRTEELRRGGVRLPLQGRPLQALAILLRNPGELVTREQLRQELWADDTFVDFEHGLHNAVARLRSILGDDAVRPRFIETLPRRGARFIPPLETSSPEIQLDASATDLAPSLPVPALPVDSTSAD